MNEQTVFLVQCYVRLPQDSTAAQSNDTSGAVGNLACAIGLNVAETGFADFCENISDFFALALFQIIVHINKLILQRARELSANRRFAAAHKSAQHNILLAVYVVQTLFRHITG